MTDICALPCETYFGGAESLTMSSATFSCAALWTINYIATITPVPHRWRSIYVYLAIKPKKWPPTLDDWRRYLHHSICFSLLLCMMNSWLDTVPPISSGLMPAARGPGVVTFRQTHVCVNLCMGRTHKCGDKHIIKWLQTSTHTY